METRDFLQAEFDMHLEAVEQIEARIGELLTRKEYLEANMHRLVSALMTLGGEDGS